MEEIPDSGAESIMSVMFRFHSLETFQKMNKTVMGVAQNLEFLLFKIIFRYKIKTLLNFD